MPKSLNIITTSKYDELLGAVYNDLVEFLSKLDTVDKHIAAVSGIFKLLYSDANALAEVSEQDADKCTEALQKFINEYYRLAHRAGHLLLTERAKEAFLNDSQS